MIWHCPPDTGFEIGAGSPQYCIFRSEQQVFLCHFKARVGFEPAFSDIPTSKQAALTTAPEPPPDLRYHAAVGSSEIGISHQWEKLWSFRCMTNRNKQFGRTRCSGIVQIQATLGPNLIRTVTVYLRSCKLYLSITDAFRSMKYLYFVIRVEMVKTWCSLYGERRANLWHDRR